MVPISDSDEKSKASG
jgi:hypothetical protein